MSAFFSGDTEPSLQLLGESLSIYRQLGYDPGIAASLAYTCTVHFARGEFERSREAGEEAVRLQRRLGDLGELEYAMFHLERTEIEVGNYERARELLHEHLELSRVTGTMSSAAPAHCNLARLALIVGDLGAARDHFQRYLRASHELGWTGDVPLDIRFMASVFAREGKYNEAIRIWSASDRAVGDLWHMFPQSRVVLYRQELSDVRRVVGEEAWHREWAYGQRLSIDEALSLALEEPMPPDSFRVQQPESINRGQPGAP
jgi:tetratricopeptide (TPR) repeat protein